jgi:hypothetical protein
MKFQSYNSILSQSPSLHIRILVLIPMSQLVKEFKVVPLRLQKNSSVIHYLYLKEHGEKTMKGGVLFVGNVDCGSLQSNALVDEYLRTLFGRFGDIETISVSEYVNITLDKARFAHITFAKKQSVKLALSATDEDYEVAGEDVSRILKGLNTSSVKNISHLRSLYPLADMDYRSMQTEVDQYMQQFDEEQRKLAEQEKIATSTPDDDGFVLVRSKR